MNYESTLMWKELNEYGKVFEHARQNMETWRAAAEEIKGRTCGFVGAARGTSDHALVFFKYLAEIFTPYPVGFAACSTLTKYGGKVNFAHSAVLGVSQSGKAADVLSVIEKAKADGGVTVSITNDETSPLAKAASYHIFLGAGEEKSVAATKTFTAQCVALLQCAAVLSGEPVLFEALERLPSVISENLPALHSISDELSDTLKETSDGFLLSRGISYALALEGSLKLQETSYVRMKGYADSDFLHGPMAMIGEGTKVLALAPALGFTKAQSEERKEELLGVFSKLQKQGAALEIVTNERGYEPFGKVHFLRGGRNELETYFLLALLIQMTACKTSCKKGIDPDAPRALSKVTVTK